jgi:TRAP-type uncharacterized transport system fused permease subunit
MFLGIAQRFGVQESIIKTFTRIFAKRKTLIPQTAVVTSMAVATFSGSGAANATITGQYTIPLMKIAGFPALHAHFFGGLNIARGLWRILGKEQRHSKERYR